MLFSSATPPPLSFALPTLEFLLFPMTEIQCFNIPQSSPSPPYLHLVMLSPNTHCNSLVPSLCKFYPPSFNVQCYSSCHKASSTATITLKIVSLSMTHICTLLCINTHTCDTNTNPKKTALRCPSMEDFTEQTLQPPLRACVCVYGVMGSLSFKVLQ